MQTTRDQITGLVLAGGRGTRMGGADKGLQTLHGEPLAAHVLRRLAPQTGALLISANRHPDAYATLGAPCDQHPPYRLGKIGIIGGFSVVSAHINHLVTQAFKITADLLLEEKTRVIGSPFSE